MVSKFQTMRKPNIATTTSLAGLFLTIDSTCLNDSIVIKIKKPATLSFFFKKLFYFCEYDNSVLTI